MAKTIDLSIALDDTAYALYTQLRGNVPEAQFCHQVFQLGLCEIIQATTSDHRDLTLRSLDGQTEEYVRGRTVLFQTYDDSTDIPAKGASEDKSAAATKAPRDYAVIKGDKGTG